MSRCWGGTFCRATAPCFQVRHSILLHLRWSKFILLCRFERRVGGSNKRPFLKTEEPTIDLSPSQDHPLGADQHRTHTFDPPDASDRPNKKPKTETETETETEKKNKTKAKTTGKKPQRESASGSSPSNSQQPATSAPPTAGPGTVPGTRQRKWPAAAAPPLQGPFGTSSTSTQAPPEPGVPTGPGPFFTVFEAHPFEGYPDPNHPAPAPAPERVTDNPGVSYPHPSQNP